MPLPKLLQKALTALLRTVELTTDPKQALQILTQHFTLSSHDLMNACQLSYEHALQAISIGLGRADLTAPHVVQECAQEVVRDAWETFVSQHSQLQVATFQTQAIGHCQTLAKLPVFVSADSRALTESELATILLDKGALNLTQLVLDQWQSLPAARPCLESTLVAFLQQDDLFGQALWFCFQEQLRREPRVATTLQTLATQGLWQDMRELKQHLQQQMKTQQVSAEIKPQDEVVTQHTSESLRFIAQAVQRLKRLPVNHPQYSQLAIQGASLLSSAGELERAEGLLQQAKQVAVSDTDRALAAFNLFQVLLRRGKAFYPQALRELQEAMQLHRERYALHDVEKYPIVQILGAGGMGCVFLCAHRLRKEQVVVKCFWEKRTGAVEEVFKEAFAMRDLPNQYVPKPLDYGWVGKETRQRAFFVTEYVAGAMDGETWLETHGGKLDEATGWQVGWQVAQALQLAHQQGVLHLDLKPANILLLQGESSVTVKLIDFGLSQLAAPLQQRLLTRQGNTQLSALGQAMFGTLDYAAPEQQGYVQWGKPSEKSDVFGYGQTMKRLLSGKSPRLCRERDLPQEWQALLFDCTEEVPQQRPTVADILRQLEVKQKPVSSEAESVPLTPKPETKREPRLAPKRQTWPAVAGILVVVGVVGWWMVNKGSSPVKPKPVSEGTKPVSVEPEIVVKETKPTPVVTQGSKPKFEMVTIPPAGPQFEMVTIPAGFFRMGDIRGTGDSDEQPVHTVTVKSFAMSRHEVTFEEYDYFAEQTGREKPKDEGWGNRPVINVSWEDATAYAEWLSGQTGKQYRLPTEAEWEYAARAGTETDYWWGNEIGGNHANCDGCGSQWDNKLTAPVCSFVDNSFGLCDTVGNVWEWTCSEYEEKYNGKELECIGKNRANDGGLRVIRGGAWSDIPQRVRASYRRGARAYWSYSVGFRLARM